MSMLGAILRSLFDIKIDFYPRLGTEKIKSVSSDLIIREMVEATKHWKEIDPTDANLDKAIELARASLNEAKQQTEYQDQKATRLLLVTTFLTALAGTFFTTFSSNYPVRTLSSVAGVWNWFLIATYVAFLLFVLSALTGALVTFHSTRSRFKYPPEATVDRQAGPTRSYLFFREIIGVSPIGWANSFVTITEEDDRKRAVLNADLKVQYLQNYVSEAYLVATKTADKLRYLQPAQSLLAWALRFLLAFIVLLVVVTTKLNPAIPASEPYKVELSPPAASVPVDDSAEGATVSTPSEGSEP